MLMVLGLSLQAVARLGLGALTGSSDRWHRASCRRSGSPGRSTRRPAASRSGWSTVLRSTLEPSSARPRWFPSAPGQAGQLRHAGVRRHRKGLAGDRRQAVRIGKHRKVH